jgi:hypothetical protein
LPAFCSFFQQILNLFPRAEFDYLVAQSKAERHARGFSSWDQFVATGRSPGHTFVLS